MVAVVFDVVHAVVSDDSMHLLIAVNLFSRSMVTSFGHSLSLCKISKSMQFVGLPNYNMCHLTVDTLWSIENWFSVAYIDTLLIAVTKLNFHWPSDHT